MCSKFSRRAKRTLQSTDGSSGDPCRYSLQPSPQPQPANPPVAPTANEVISPQPKKTNKNLWIGLGIAITTVCVCTILGVALVATGVGKVMVERAPVESVLDTYLRHMAGRDIEGAYALFSPRAQRQVPISNLEELIEGLNYVVFEGYQSLSVQNINFTAAANTNPDVPQGTVATVDGTISYEGGFEGTFRGTLEKVDGKWQIDGIFVTVPPNKFQP